MNDTKSDYSEAEAPGGSRRWMQRGILGVVGALVIGVYAYTAQSGYLITTGLDTAHAYYNLMVQGFRAGQLNLKLDPPSALAQLANPYDPSAYSRLPVLDLSYYKGKFYLYFGVTPALVLFWPYAALTGHYLTQTDAVLVFCAVGFLVGMGLLSALWRRYFAEASVGVVAAGTLALGLATGTPFLLAACDVYEVAISCGYAFAMLALAAIWMALHAPRQRGRWLAAASLACGLAVGARPSLLFGAVILLVPVAQAWRERRPVLAPLVAATAPIALIGLGLMLYNALRFDSPFEFGWRYQLAGEEQLMRRMFSLHFLWFNFRIYFLEPARWSAHFPFVHARLLPSVPAGHEHEMECFGVLTTVPLVWLALAAPLAWRNRSGSTDPALGWFLTAAALQFGICALTLGLICCAGVRYELDFLPALVLLAVIGILGLERAVATPGAAVTHRPVRRRLVRWGWSLLLAFSVVFNLFVSVARSAQAHDNFGAFLLRVGRTQEAFEQYQQALRLRPDDAEAHNNLGGILEQMGQMSVAVGYYKEAVRLNPYYFQARSSLGLALAQQGMMREAIEQFEAALRIRPDDAETHYDLGLALAQESRIPEAIEQFKQVLRVRPDDFDAHNGLGAALAQVGRMPEAIEQFEQVLRIKPDYAEAHYNVGIALEKTGRVPEAIQHYEQALRLRPDLAAARNALARLQGSQ